MRISDWSSDVCSSDLTNSQLLPAGHNSASAHATTHRVRTSSSGGAYSARTAVSWSEASAYALDQPVIFSHSRPLVSAPRRLVMKYGNEVRSAAHTSELPSLMRNSYSPSCLT